MGRHYVNLVNFNYPHIDLRIGDKATELKNIIQQKDVKDFDGINLENMSSSKEQQQQLQQRLHQEIDQIDETIWSQEVNMLPDMHIDLDDVPNLTDMSDDLLDADLLMLKFNVLNSTDNFQYQ